MAGFVMQIDTYIIDSFTATPFKGNPTSVCYTQSAIRERDMLAIANELNQPVTAFIQQIKPGEYSIRYFTPITEIPACGHGTLGAARAASLESGLNNVVFNTKEGVVIHATIDDDLVMMTYPKYEMQPFKVTKAILKSLPLDAFKSAGYCRELECLFIETDASRLRSIKPDYRKMVQSTNAIVEIVITSADDTNGYDYLLRSFCPWIGIDEDPVTGSVHTVLSGFWQQRLNKSQLRAYQASARGGEVIVNAFDDKTEIGGKTAVVLKGAITLSADSRNSLLHVF
ncbi:MAG TPA: PhzF family phenazine biosynthesis protein [Chitinophagaceae bacterium]